MLSEMSSREFLLWQVFDVESPVGDERADLGFGIVASTLVNWSGKQMKTGAAAALPRDFMPYVPPVEVKADEAVSRSIREAFLKYG